MTSGHGAALEETVAVFDVVGTPGTPLTASEVADHLDCTRRTAYDRLMRLSEDGDLRTKKVGARGRVWWREERDAAVDEDLADPRKRSERGGERTDAGTVERERERALRRSYEIVADPDRTFPGTVEALLAVARNALGTDGAAFSRVQNGDSAPEVVVEAGHPGLDAGDDESPTAPACERVVETGRTLSLDDVASAPDLSDPRELVERGLGSYLGAPVTVDDEAVGTVCFYGAEPQAGGFSDWAVTFADLLGNWVGCELERHRYADRLSALDNLNAVVRDVTDVVVDQSTREEIERTVCEALAASDSYEFAWIGDADGAGQSVALRAEAGVRRYLDDRTVPVAADAEACGEPAGRALATRTIQVERDVRSGSTADRWTARAETYGFQSTAAIPILNEGTPYGVLSVYADRPHAFAGEERAMVAQLGEIVGHAIGSAERKRALTSEEVVEVEFRVRDLFEAAGVPVETTGLVTFDRTVPVAADEYLVYGTATEDATDAVTALVDAFPHWEEITFRPGDDPPTFELLLTEPPVVSAVAALGGVIDSAVVADGDFRMTVHLSPGVDVRQVTDVVEDTYPTAEMMSRRQVSRPNDGPVTGSHQIAQQLTERQRAALETAHLSGFFEWPRESSGEEVASSLDVSAPTFHQHLRKAERKVFDALFATTDD